MNPAGAVGSLRGLRLGFVNLRLKAQLTGGHARARPASHVVRGGNEQS
jgi:hypothetical protein